MKPAIDVIGTDKCASCFACYNACPENAIKMQLDEEGFYKPIVNYDRCTNCGICSNKCPIINFNSDNNPKPIYYAVWSKDNSIRFSSSSGGVFSELASFILKQKGVVYGVAWDKNFYVKHIRIDSEEGLSLLRGSKYIQSYVGKIYKDVLNNLKKGKKVLFSGTPCQVAALKKIVGNDNNLYTADLVCHGVPSIKVFKEYLDYLSNGNKVKKIEFRNKENGWAKYKIKIDFVNAQSYSVIYYKDPFFRGFLKNYYLNRICYNCPFSKIPRTGDITLGDFWGVPETLKNEKGVSLVLVNNKKGEKLIEQLNNIDLVPVAPNIAIKQNPRLVNGNYTIPKERDFILNEIEKFGFNYVLKKYLKYNYKKELVRKIKNKFLKAVRKVIKWRRDISI